MIWSKFRVFLRQLERQPLRLAFDELPKKRVIFSPFFQFTARHAEFSMFVAIRERLTGLKSEWALSDSSSDSPEAIDDLTEKVANLLGHEAEGSRISRQKFAPLRNQLAKVNADFTRELNRDFWNLGHSASGSGVDEMKNTEKDGSAAKEARNDITASREALREEIIALQYANYIQYILHQQRNLLFFVPTGFMLSILALHAYPFQQTITTFITIIFIAFTAGVVTVLSEAERDPILSRMTNTTPGELSGAFFLKIAGVHRDSADYGAGIAVPRLGSIFVFVDSAGARGN